MQPDSILHKPSKRIFALVIVVLAVIISVILFKSDPSNTTPSLLSNTDVRGVVVSEKDSDMDGLKDWEESLWGTNPNKADSNDDGTSDFKEVQDKKAVTLATREQIINSATSSAFSYFEQDSSLTKTDAISRALFEQVIAFKNAGIPLTPEDAAKIASTLGGDFAAAPQINQKQFQLSDLLFVESPTPAQIHTYGNAVAGALKVKTSEKNNEFFVLGEFAEKGKPSALLKLDPVIQHYKDLVNKLRAIPTPREISPSYLELINTTQATAAILEQIKNFSNDSVVLVPMLQAYQKNYDARINALRAIKTYLLAEDITYTTLEDGFLIVTME